MAKGLALHESLVRHSSEPFNLHILTCDMDTFWILSELNLPHVELIPLEAFEHQLKLQPVRESRSRTEYLWTLASCLMDYLLPWHESITYLDADVFFFSDPNVIYEEIGEKSIGITPHRFATKDRARLAKNGEFNVGVVYAKNSSVGRACISRWANQCRAWCFNRNEGGKFGDQAYLDAWPKDYQEEVRVIENVGVNLGPWSVNNFIVHERFAKVCVHNDKLVCYHFHEYVSPSNPTRWELRECDRKLIYEPYNRAFTAAQFRIASVNSSLKSRRQSGEQRMQTA